MEATGILRNVATTRWRKNSGVSNHWSGAGDKQIVTMAAFLLCLESKSDSYTERFVLFTNY